MRDAFRLPALLCAVTLASWIVVATPTRAGEPTPIIVTYERHKARTDARAAVRDPKSFWVGQIVGRIEDRKPKLNLSLRAPLTVAISFVVGRDGRLLSSSVARSSGDPAVDRQAVAVLASAAPFPPMPAGLSDDSMSFSLPLRFK